MKQKQNSLPIVLSIAGFDPSGGAGIIADVKTIQAFSCRPVAAITSLTFQNSQGVFGAIHQTADSLRAQVIAIIDDLPVAAVKVGMLPTRELVLEVTRLLRENQLPAPVVDPVLRSTSGYDLIEDNAIEPLVRALMPLARVITPNIPEAERLTNLSIKDEDGMRKGASRLRELGARAVLIKGGHLRRGSGVGGQWPVESSREAIDLLDDQGQVTIFRGEWIDAQRVRGTGCMLSSAIAVGLAKGAQLNEAVAVAKRFVSAEVQNSKLKTEN